MAQSNNSKAGWLIPAGLLFLSIAPLLGGAIRVSQLASGDVTEDNARFFADPIPILIHAVSSLVYFILGAFQFSPSIRANYPHWHRGAGRILVPAGLVCVLTGIWMAQFYAPFIGEGLALRWIRTFVGIAMMAFILRGLHSINQRRFADHRAWMMRGYALAIAAGTQPLTLIPFAVIPAAQNEVGYTLGLSGGWLMNAVLAEYLIRRQATRA